METGDRKWETTDLETGGRRREKGDGRQEDRKGFSDDIWKNLALIIERVNLSFF